MEGPTECNRLQIPLVSKKNLLYYVGQSVLRFLNLFLQ